MGFRACPSCERWRTTTAGSKYVAEPEKKLSEAESPNTTAVFDEPYAMFGRCIDVPYTQGRHGNIETGHLLQRMEE